MTVVHAMAPPPFMFSSLSGERLVYCVKPHLNILCIGSIGSTHRQQNIKFSRLNTASNFHWENILNSHGLKMADTSKDGLLLGGGILRITTTSVFTRGS